MKCTKCGADLTDSDLFCNECGARVELMTEHEAVEAKPHATDASKCAKCGADLTGGDLFCNVCGARVESMTEPESVVPAPNAAVIPTSGTYVESDVIPKNGANVELSTGYEASESIPHITATSSPQTRVDINEVSEHSAHVESITGHEAVESEQRAIVTPKLDARTEAESDALRNAIICMQCGRKNRPWKRFCKSCGAPLIAEVHELAQEPETEAEPVPPTSPDAETKSSTNISFVAIVGLILVAVVCGGFVFMRATNSATDTQASNRSDSERISSAVNEDHARESIASDPASYNYYTCSGYVQVDTKDGSLLNVRLAPGVVDPIVFQVPDNSKLRVDGWTWELDNSVDMYWLRVVDHGGFVLGWVSRKFCDESNVDFQGSHPYGQYETRKATRTGSCVRRKHDPAAYDANYATGHITVTAKNHDLNVRPAPGVVDDVVFILTDKYGCKVNGWSYDQFESGTNRIWLRLTDNHDNILGWVNAKFCDTKYVESF